LKRARKLAMEHSIRILAFRAGRNPFCLSCGGHRERFGAPLCLECRGWANRLALRAARRKLRASFAVIDGGREVSA
jgi:hypothetical protein